MIRSERGFVSVIGVGVVVPFLFVLLIIGVELNQFLGLREDVQRVVDEEARVSLSRNFSSSEVSDRLRGRLAESRPYLELSSVQHAKQSASSNQIVAEGEYRGMIAKIGAAFLGSEIPGIRFAVVARARRADASVLVVVDRTIPLGAAPCADPHLRSRVALASRLVSGLRKVGVSTIDVAFTPGTQGAAELLTEAAPEALACGDGDAGVSRIAGTTTATTDSLEVAYGVSRLVFSRPQVNGMEQRSVVMITDATSIQGEKTTTTFALLTMEAKRSGFSVKQVGIAVGEEGGEPPFLAKSGESSGSARYLVVSDDTAREGNVPGVVAQHINGRTFIAE